MTNAFTADIDLLTAADSGHRSQTLGLAVHTSESDTTADDLAIFCQDTSNEASYNLIIDKAGRTARSNDDEFAPWAAMPTGNDRLFHVCLTGYAEFTADEWMARPDQLDKLAEVLAVYGNFYRFDIEKISAADLRAGRKGVCGHDDISKAWGETDHWDPGPNFWRDPWTHVRNMAIAGSPDDKETTVSFTNADRQMLRDIWDQLRGPEGKGWPQLGRTAEGDDLTPVDALADIRRAVLRDEAADQ